MKHAAHGEKDFFHPRHFLSGEGSQRTIPEALAIQRAHLLQHDKAILQQTVTGWDGNAQGLTPLKQLSRQRRGNDQWLINIHYVHTAQYSLYHHPQRLCLP